MNLRKIDRMDRDQLLRRVHADTPERIYGIVGQAFILDEMVDGVDPEAVNPLIEPITQHVQHCADDVGIAPVEVRLTRQEGVIVILASQVVPCPGRSAEGRPPIVRGCTVGSRISPDKPVAARIASARTAFLEPPMLIGSVIGNVVHDKLQPGRMDRVHQLAEGLHIPKQRIDRGMVGHVIAEVRHRRRIYGREPDSVDPEGGDIVQPLDDTLDVADPITIGVLKRPRVNLIDHPVFPPNEICRAACEFFIKLIVQSHPISAVRTSLHVP